MCESYGPDPTITDGSGTAKSSSSRSGSRDVTPGLPPTWSNDQSVGEDGPVFLKLHDAPGHAKLNNFSACNNCRASHLACSLRSTGGPCSLCKSHNIQCEVYGWSLNPQAPRQCIYKPVFPPPPVAPPSPSSSPGPSQSQTYEFQWEELARKLKWLKEEAPSKLRKRPSAMQWDESMEPMPDRFCPDLQLSKSSIGPSRKRRKGLQTQSPCKHTELEKTSPLCSKEGCDETRGSSPDSESDGSSSAFSSPPEKYPSRCVFDSDGIVSQSINHRMSIQFILSPSPSERPIGVGKPESAEFNTLNHRWDSCDRTVIGPQTSWSTTSSSTCSLSFPPLEFLHIQKAHPRSPRPRIPSLCPLAEFSKPELSFSTSQIDKQDCTLPPLRQYCQY